MRTAILAALAALPLLSGCLAAVAAGAIGGIVLSSEVVDNNIYEVRLNMDVQRVWTTAKQVLSDTSTDTIQIDETIRMAKAKVDGSMVTVTCEAYDLDTSTMKTRATKYAGTMNDAEMARLIQERIITRLDRQK